MSHSKIFFYSCLSFILGVFIRSIWEINSFSAYLVLLGALLFFCLVWRNKYFLVLGIWGLFLFLGIWRYQISLPVNLPDRIFYYNEEKVELVGIVATEPQVGSDKTKLTVAASEVKINDRTIKVSGKVLVSTYLFPEYFYGDKLKIICALQKPGMIQDFNYGRYLGKDNIYSLCYQPQITLLEKNKGNFLLAGIYRAKGYFVSRLNRVLPEPQSSFLAGILIGAQKSMPQKLSQIFSQTGTSHLVAVSGYNVTIIAAFLMLLFQNLGLGRKKSFWVILSCLVCFVILTGLQSSIVRAGIMGALVLTAGYLGRLSKIKIALALAGALMILANPKILLDDLGFQLSFLATLGLVYLSPVLGEICRIKKLPKFWQGIGNNYLLPTVSAIIFTQPLILYNFGKISLVAPLANLLVLPLVPLAMLLGFITGLASLVWLSLGRIIGWSIWLVLSYMLWILQTLSGLPWSFWQIPKISAVLMVVFYAGISGLIIFFRRSRKQQQKFNWQ